MDLDVSLASVAAYGAPGALDRLKEHLDPTWIEDALTWSGTTSIRRRRLPADQVVWLVIGMALYRNQPIEHIVDMLDLALPDKKDTLVAKSAIAQARRRLTEEPLAYLFATTAAEWAKRSADAHRWRGLSLYGLDGTTIRVPDSPENRAVFGGSYAGALRGESGYPQVRAVAVMALRSHVMSAFRFADYATGETTLARDVWSEVPEDSLVIVDRNFLVANELIHLESSGNRHWLSRAKTRTRYSVVEKLGTDDELVIIEIDQPGLPRQWVMRAIHYQVKGHPRSTLLTSLTDPKLHPAKELVELYHERWEAEIAYDEVKTHLLAREEAIRSRTPDGVRQELWGIAIAYNLVRLEIERVAAEAGVSPTRISFVAAVALVRDEIAWLNGRRLALGTIPARLQHLRRNLKRLVLPPRRERSYPRAVKVKMSNYPRKRPTPRRPK